MKKQNVVLKVVIGLMMGIGALTFAPKAAHATTPCTPDAYPVAAPPETHYCGTDCTIVPPIARHGLGCFDFDGDCTKETRCYEVSYYLQCNVGDNCYQHAIEVAPCN
jgi:hypothetical protein